LLVIAAAGLAALAWTAGSATLAALRSCSAAGAGGCGAAAGLATGACCRAGSCASVSGVSAAGASPSSVVLRRVSTRLSSLPNAAGVCVCARPKAADNALVDKAVRAATLWDTTGPDMCAAGHSKRCASVDVHAVRRASARNLLPGGSFGPA
jgi:hypothetical protein